MRDIEYFLDSILEGVVYAAKILLVTIAIITSPIWAIPYLIYKRTKQVLDS